MKKDQRKTLVLLDSHAILHRAYHALPDFSSSKGEPTGALYGLASMLLKIIADLKPDYIIACYDLPQKTYRHEAYDQYKAGRKKADDELVSQIKRSRELLGAFNIPIYDAPGFEADDVLGTIVEKNHLGDVRIIIASGDMDTLQLVDDDKVLVYTLKKGINDTVLYDEKAVTERFGFGPKLLSDYKGLRGDPSDNIPGIVGVGEKTASIIIQNFGSLEDVYKKLKKDRNAFLKVGLKERIVKLLEDNEEEAFFSKSLGTIRRDAPIDFAIPSKTFTDSLSLDKLKSFFDELEFRTFGARVDKLFAPTQGTLVEEGVDEENYSEEDASELKVMMWLVDSNRTNPEVEDILRITKSKNISDAKEKLIKEMREKDVYKVFELIEKPLTPVLERLNKTGVLIDKKVLEKLSVEYHEMLTKTEKDIWKMVGKEFNVASPKQLAEILFQDLGIKTLRAKRTPGGAISTKESELLKIQDEHPVISLVLRHRELSKLLSTYIDAIPNLLSKDGRLRTTFIQTGTTTGRLSSRDPNLQNIPIRTEEGRAIRKAFISDKGKVLVAGDYSQIELRMAAILSGDSFLKEAFIKGEDIHQSVASRVFNVSVEEVDKEMRRKAKVINFGILYGMGVNALKQSLNSSREEAKKFYDQYFIAYPQLAEYIDKSKKEVVEKGYTETLFGRKRYFSGITSGLQYIRAEAERMAINAPLQGTSADVIKLAMIGIDEYIQKEKIDAKLIMQIHDELMYEVGEKDAEVFAKKMKEIMEKALPDNLAGGVPIEVDVSAGPSWLDLK